MSTAIIRVRTTIISLLVSGWNMPLPLNLRHAPHSYQERVVFAVVLQAAVTDLNALSTYIDGRLSSVVVGEVLIPLHV